MRRILHILDGFIFLPPPPPYLSPRQLLFLSLRGGLFFVDGVGQVRGGVATPTPNPRSAEILLRGGRTSDKGEMAHDLAREDTRLDDVICLDIDIFIVIVET